MDNRIPKDSFALLFSSAISKMEDLELLGRNIGNRISEDYFFRIKATSKIGPGDVPGNICLFFTTYFSYTPRQEDNVIFLGDFYGFKYAKEGNLKIFKGIFEVIYKYLSKDPVEFQIDEAKRCIMVLK